ncbi:hypothetical protein BD413DRAFT_242191 [Trametes elegans]|nr:hypothetical protein BD413DRAFT_242191 [Trametes elegans]
MEVPSSSSSSSSSSSFCSSSEPETPLHERVEQMYASYMQLPRELCAASRPSSPMSEERIADWKDHISHAVKVARGETTNPKWGYVSRITQLACTDRGYVGIAPGVRMADGRKAPLDMRFNRVLPETDVEWEEYERRWYDAVALGGKKAQDLSDAKFASTAPRTSKYWPKPVEEPPAVEEQPAAASSSRPAQQLSKAAVIHAKVSRWQAEVVTDPDDEPPSQPAASQCLADGKTKTRDQPPTDVKSSRSAASKPKATPPRPYASAQHDPHPMAIDGSSQPRSPRGGQRPSASSQDREHHRIEDLPELSFLPPSFPSQLQTSTPPPNFKRHKPAPIAPCSPPPSASQTPHSSRSFDPSRPQRQDPPLASSSQPPSSPAHRLLKRARTPNSSADVCMDVSQSPLSKVPPAKKARTGPNAEQEPPSSGPQPVPPSTPPPTSSLNAPVTPISRGKGLGNAKGLPVPTTPDRHNLPTLTELLASSRRSKPRPRPPSRKHTPNHRAAVKAKPASEQHEEDESALPAVAENDREPSPAKTYFSSPASGSSDSGSVVHRSPVSPLFSQNPGAFAPAAVSSQRPGAMDDDPFLVRASQGLSQSQGLLGMGYNSQFDVEGEVGRVSELLERDVDFNGWLRDLDEAEEMPQSQSQNQSRSQGTVGVGY